MTDAGRRLRATPVQDPRPLVRSISCWTLGRYSGEMAAAESGPSSVLTSGPSPAGAARAGPEGETPTGPGPCAESARVVRGPIAAAPGPEDLQLLRWVADLRGLRARAPPRRPPREGEEPESAMVRLAAHLLARYRREADDPPGDARPGHAKMRFKLESRELRGRVVEEAACLWLALKLLGEQEGLPGAERVAQVAGTQKALLMRAEARIASSLQWKLLDGFVLEDGVPGATCAVH